VENGYLQFRYHVNKEPCCDFDLAAGTFRKGLWERDVAEFFVGAVGSPVYQEVNISPTGAWWSALFSEYRVLEREIKFKPLIETARKKGEWSLLFRAGVENFVPWQGTDETKRTVSATSILYHPEPNYFAWNHTLGGEPDFHRADLLKPWASVPYTS
jgi:hypothetical protein